MDSLYGHLVVIKRNNEDGGYFPIEESQITIGRDEDNDIRIMIPKVSRKHAILTAVPQTNTLELQNLSKNFVLVNHQKIPGNSTSFLHSGDVLTIAERSFRFEAPQPPQENQQSEKKTNLLDLLETDPSRSFLLREGKLLHFEEEAFVAYEPASLQSLDETLPREVQRRKSRMSIQLQAPDDLNESIRQVLASTPAKSTAKKTRSSPRHTPSSSSKVRRRISFSAEYTSAPSTLDLAENGGSNADLSLCMEEEEDSYYSPTNATIITASPLCGNGLHNSTSEERNGENILYPSLDDLENDDIGSDTFRPTIDLNDQLQTYPHSTSITSDSEQNNSSSENISTSRFDVSMELTGAFVLAGHMKPQIGSDQEFRLLSPEGCVARNPNPISILKRALDETTNPSFQSPTNVSSSSNFEKFSSARRQPLSSSKKTRISFAPVNTVLFTPQKPTPGRKSILKQTLCADGTPEHIRQERVLQQRTQQFPQFQCEDQLMSCDDDKIDSLDDRETFMMSSSPVSFSDQNGNSFEDSLLEVGLEHSIPALLRPPAFLDDEQLDSDCLKVDGEESISPPEMSDRIMEIGEGEGEGEEEEEEEGKGACEHQTPMGDSEFSSPQLISFSMFQSLCKVDDLSDVLTDNEDESGNAVSLLEPNSPTPISTSEMLSSKSTLSSRTRRRRSRPSMTISPLPVSAPRSISPSRHNPSSPKSSSCKISGMNSGDSIASRSPHPTVPLVLAPPIEEQDDEDFGNTNHRCLRSLDHQLRDQLSTDPEKTIHNKESPERMDDSDDSHELFFQNSSSFIESVQNHGTEESTENTAVCAEQQDSSHVHSSFSPPIDLREECGFEGKDEEKEQPQPVGREEEEVLKASNTQLPAVTKSSPIRSSLRPPSTASRAIVNDNPKPQPAARLSFPFSLSSMIKRPLTFFFSPNSSRSSHVLPEKEPKLNPEIGTESELQTKEPIVINQTEQPIRAENESEIEIQAEAEECNQKQSIQQQEKAQPISENVIQQPTSASLSLLSSDVTPQGQSQTPGALFSTATVIIPAFSTPQQFSKKSQSAQRISEQFKIWQQLRIARDPLTGQELCGPIFLRPTNTINIPVHVRNSHYDSVWMSTIYDKINSKRYSSLSSLFADFSRLFNNVLLMFPEASSIEHCQASKLLSVLDQLSSPLSKNVCQTIREPSQHSQEQQQETETEKCSEDSTLDVLIDVPVIPLDQSAKPVLSNSDLSSATDDVTAADDQTTDNFIAVHDQTTDDATDADVFSGPDAEVVESIVQNVLEQITDYQPFGSIETIGEESESFPEVKQPSLAQSPRVSDQVLGESIEFPPVVEEPEAERSSRSFRLKKAISRKTSKKAVKKPKSVVPSRRLPPQEKTEKISIFFEADQEKPLVSILKTNNSNQKAKEVVLVDSLELPKSMECSGGDQKTSLTSIPEPELGADEEQEPSAISKTLTKRTRKVGESLPKRVPPTKRQKSEEKEKEKEKEKESHPSVCLQVVDSKAEKYSLMTVIQLRSLLKKKGSDTLGRKQELIDRLIQIEQTPVEQTPSNPAKKSSKELNPPSSSSSRLQRDLQKSLKEQERLKKKQEEQTRKEELRQKAAEELRQKAAEELRQKAAEELRQKAAEAAAEELKQKAAEAAAEELRLKAAEAAAGERKLRKTKEVEAKKSSAKTTSRSLRNTSKSSKTEPSVEDKENQANKEKTIRANAQIQVLSAPALSTRSSRRQVISSTAEAPLPSNKPCSAPTFAKKPVEYNQENLEQSTVLQLRTILKKKGLPTLGKKDELIERLLHL